MKYKAVKGSHINDETAQVAGEFLSTLEEKYQELSPAVVLTEAQPETSPIHGLFTWDNAAAAAKYRDTEARYLLRSINVVVTMENGDEREVRAFHNVTVTHTPQLDEPGEEQVVSVYVNARRALTEDDLRAQVIAGALRELKQWQEKYKNYQEFAIILKAVDEVLQVMK